ncbi:MAG TPA: hypothetical protein VM451_01070 [Candidatus Limnocylindria bacterium]|nr:hypothetical protein [Candidatus Limnocylindria bacterium]
MTGRTDGATFEAERVHAGGRGNGRAGSGRSGDARERGAPKQWASDGASFASTRISPPRRRPPIVVLGFLVAVGALVAVGIAGRPATPSATARPVAAATSRPSEPAPGSAAPTAEASVAPSRQPIGGPRMTSEPGPLALAAQREVDSVFVHGDVFVKRVTWVFVSVRDASGRIAGWASLSVPGAAGLAVGDGPAMLFDLELAAPYADYPTALDLHATAYDSTGRVIATGRIEKLSTRFIIPLGGDATGFRRTRFDE